MIAAERRFSPSADNTVCAVAVCDPNGTIQFANQQMGRWLNCEPASLRSVTFTRILAPASALLFEMHLRPRLALGQRIEGAFLTLQDANGTRTPTVINAAQHADGVMDIALVSVREREAYEESLRRAHVEAEASRAALADSARALRESEALVRLQFSALPFPTYVWRRDTRGQFQLEGCNAAAQELAGLESLQSALHATSALGNDADAIAAMHRALREDQAINVELLPAERVIGSACTLQLTLGPLAPDRVIMHARDVTREREIEAQQRHGMKMQSLGQMVAGIAHEFNNVLAVIQGNLELMSGDVKQALPQRTDIADDLDTVQNATRRAVELVSQLLVFSGRRPSERGPVAVNQSVQEAARLLRPVLGRAITLTTALEASVDVVHADSDELTQVITNLVINARDAVTNRAPAEICISTANVTVGVTEDAEGVTAGAYIRLEVRDNGIGMTPEVRERALEPFFTTKDAGHGTGLGLSMIYGVVRELGGAVRIDSEPGCGTAVSLLLPVADR